MRNGRPASRPITNPLATTPSSLVTRRKCSSLGPSQGAHMTSRSTLDLRTLGSAICAYSVGGVGENHRTERCSCSATSGPQSLRYERPRSPEIRPQRERDQGADPEAHREAGGAGGPRIGGVTKPGLNAKQFAPNLWTLYLGRRERCMRESDMPPPAEMSGQHEKVRQQSRAAWGAVARGWVRSARRTLEGFSSSQRVDGPKARSAARGHRARTGRRSGRHRAHGGTRGG